MANENVIEQYPYTLGRGKLLVREDGDIQWIDLANIPEFNVTVTTEKLDHESSRHGLKKVDKTATTKQSAEGSAVLDVPVPENIKLFFMADSITDESQTSGTVAVAEDYVVKFNRWTKIAKEDLSSVVVKDVTETTTYVEGETDDYVLDAAAGLIAPIEGGGISDSDTLKITYSYGDVTISKVASATAQNQKRHIWFIGEPSDGVVEHARGFANIAPSGDLAMIGDEWQQFTLELTFEDHADYDGPVEFTDHGSV
jgi:hypothetical protein